MKTSDRYQRLVKWRQTSVDQAADAVGLVRQAIAKVEQQIERLSVERREAVQEDRQQRIGAVSVDRLLQRGRFDMQMAIDQRQLDETLGKLNVEAERRVAEWAAQKQELRRYERLVENANAAEETSRNVESQKRLDEWASGRHVRRSPSDSTGAN